jgi:hypothetical protein
MSDSNNILVNRVANSGLITLNLEEYFPRQEIVVFDIKDFLFMELILKEKDFRNALKEQDWTQYEGKILLVDCSTDAIVPVWAFMLVVGYAEPYAHDVFLGSNEEYLKAYYYKTISSMDFSIYAEKRIVIKGCSKVPVPASAYLQLTAGLRPYAQSVMYGEPCSTVPIFKRPRIVNKNK